MGLNIFGQYSKYFLDTIFFSPCVNLARLRGVRLLLPVPKVQEQRSEDEEEGVDPLQSKVHEQVELAEKLRQLPPREL